MIRSMHISQKLLCSSLPAKLSLAWHRAVASQASSTVDQFIEYGIRTCKGKHDEASDVLRSGISIAGDEGIDSARLHLALASVRLDASSLDEARSLATQAVAALDKDASRDRSEAATAAAGPQDAWFALRMQCSSVITRSLLMQGNDEDVRKILAELRKGAEREIPQLQLSLALTADQAIKPSVTHSLTPEPSILADATADLLSGSLEDRDDPAVQEEAEPWLSLGNWELCRGDMAAARRCFQRSASAAAKAGALSATQKAPLISENEWAEVEASALLGLAQADIAEEQWGPAEEQLGLALKAAEAVSYDKHPRVTLVLLLLGKVYARTARVMFAEGMYRESAKLMQLEQQAQGATPGHSLGGSRLMHPSVAAMLAWQYHQLLTALPNRGSEAAHWAETAAKLWSNAGEALSKHGIQSVLGSSERLKGQGDVGCSLVVAMRIRRCLLVDPQPSKA